MLRPLNFGAVDLDFSNGLLIFILKRAIFPCLEHSKTQSSDQHTERGEDRNDKFSLHNPQNRNCEYLAEFSLENSISCLNTKYQKTQGRDMNLHLPK